MNRADRRRQSRCKHNWLTKAWQDGRSHRWCQICEREEWHESEDDKWSFQAKYPGRCASCDERIHEGDRVRYQDDELIHESCDVPSLPNARDDLTKVCRECFTIHAGECM